MPERSGGPQPPSFLRQFPDEKSVSGPACKAGIRGDGVEKVRGNGVWRVGEHDIGARHSLESAEGGGEFAFHDIELGGKSGSLGTPAVLADGGEAVWSGLGEND